MSTRACHGLYHRCFETLTLLVVQDDAFLSKLMARTCRSFGFQSVIEVADRAAAAESIATGRIDMVLADIDTRPTDGLRLTADIRGHEMARLRATPIVLMAGQPSRQNALAAKRSGTRYLVGKPVAPTTLFECFLSAQRDTQAYARAS